MYNSYQLGALQGNEPWIDQLNRGWPLVMNGGQVNELFSLLGDLELPILHDKSAHVTEEYIVVYIK